MQSTLVASQKDWFQQKKIELLEWSAVSPDLNTIENLWGIVVRSMYADGKQYDTIIDLNNVIKTSWEYIDIDTIKKLISTMQNCIYEVVNKNGDMSRY